MPTLIHVASNVAIDLQDHLAELDDPRTDARTMQVACRKYAVIGLCFLLNRGSRGDFRVWLSMGAQAFACWQARVDDALKVTSQADAFIHAIVAGDRASAETIYRTGRSTFNQGHEYEEDFAWMRIRQELACAADPEPAVRQLLDFWKGLSGGGEAEFLLAQALIDRDASAARELMTARLDARLKQVRRWQREAAGDPDEQLTLARVDLEAAAIIRIAQDRLGMDLRQEHRLLPADLFAVVAGAPLPADAWRDEARFDAIHQML